MTTDSTGARLDAALAPLRAALLDRARARAAATLADADADAAAILDRARTEAAGLLATARARGADEAARVLDVERDRSRGVVRAAELTARRRAYDDLRSAVAERLRRFCDGPGQGPAEDGLRTWLVGLLGPQVQVAASPGGGLVGSVPGRTVDASVDALADAALDALGAGAEELWQE